MADTTVGHERELREQWERTHLDLHHADTAAVSIAREEINRRLDEMNLLRHQIEAERLVYIRRDLYDREHGSLSDRVRFLENLSANLQGRFWMIGAVISGVMILTQIALRYVGK